VWLIIRFFVSRVSGFDAACGSRLLPVDTRSTLANKHKCVIDPSITLFCGLGELAPYNNNNLIVAVGEKMAAAWSAQIATNRFL
jgi:hypothetical protein